MRCPWCQATLEISVQPRIIAEVLNLRDKQPVSARMNQPENDLPESSIVLEHASIDQKRLASNGKQGIRVVGYLYQEEKG